jgi:hypothetical protein
MTIYTDLFSKRFHLRRCEASVGKHANLRCDVAPVLFAAKFLKVLLKQCTHPDDAISHVLDLVKPLLAQGWIIENGGGDTRSMNRWIGVHGPYEDLELGLYLLLLLRRFANDRKRAAPFAV